MDHSNLLTYLEKLTANTPKDWLNLTTHRLDIYNEALAKTDFINEFEALYLANNSELNALNALPTAYDYVRLGHPLSSVLEWTLAKLNGLESKQVISFSSRTAPILAILRKNLFEGKKTLILYPQELPKDFDVNTIKKVYGYDFDTQKINSSDPIPTFDGSIVYFSMSAEFGSFQLNPNVDFYVQEFQKMGSIVFVNGDKNTDYISEIQHLRRRETIAMTPQDCHLALKAIVGETIKYNKEERHDHHSTVVSTIEQITGSSTPAAIGSSGLSVQYAIMMGLIEDAMEQHPNKNINIIVPPNCYGGTNDQARRVAACLTRVNILDLAVDGENDMVDSVEKVLEQVAKADAIPLIIAEIPTNPRVEVPNLEALGKALSKKRHTEKGEAAVGPIFILDQTFCPNVQFLKSDGLLSSVKAISYVSGSKFPSGGKCTAGYCVANKLAAPLMTKINQHMKLCDNEATPLQMAFLAEQMPSMIDRIESAYQNTRNFVEFIQNKLPSAKINFVSQELAEQGFTPSVFSLDLPTKGESHEEREQYKRALNERLIHLMITEIPDESKYCVSYGQLKGCYWTIPATSTQGTTKESDKDYIARVSVSPNLNLEKHKAVFMKFIVSIEL